MIPSFAPPTRRDMFLTVATGAALSSGCTRSRRTSGWLNYLLGMEPISLDPAKCFG